MMPEKLQVSPLDSLHKKLVARMVPFAGWSLPIQYSGIISEHQHTREKASLFDVSHMGQISVQGENSAEELGGIFPVNFSKLKPNRNKYSFACNDRGGVIDDFVIGNDGDSFTLICNASRQAEVLEHLRKMCSSETRIEKLENQALIAVQGPAAKDVVADIFPESSELFFMDSCMAKFENASCRVARCGYTGEDGFEISTEGDAGLKLATALLEHPDCEPAGLGARDTLRLEACLCLYGSELNEEITPIEAGLVWAIPPSLRGGGPFLGSEIISKQIEQGAGRSLVALQVEGKSPVRAGAQIMHSGEEIGVVTSGNYSPTLQSSIALALVASERANEGTELTALRRETQISCVVVPMPFVRHNYLNRPRKSSAKGGTK